MSRIALVLLCWSITSLSIVDPDVSNFKAASSAMVLDYTVNLNNLERDVLELVKMIIPSIAGISAEPIITMTRMTIGTINYAFKVQVDHELLMVRINSGSTASLLSDRNREVLIISLAHSGFGPKLFATYNNGYVVSFIVGDMLQLPQLRDPLYYAKIAETVSYWHKLKLPQSVEPYIQISPWLTFDKWYSIADNLGIDIENIKKEIEEIRQYLLIENKYDDRNSFTHNDLNHGNIISTPEGKIVFVDYEFSGIGNRYFDIANHFCEWCGIDFDISNFPSKEHQKTWLEIYLSHYDKNFSSLTKEEQQTQVHQLICIINSYELISHLFWSLWGKIMSSQSSVIFDYAAYSNNRLNSYKLRRTKNSWPQCDF